MNTRRLPDAATIRELAVRADVDPRTIAKELRGVPARGMAGRRAREVLIEAGLIEADPIEHKKQKQSVNTQNEKHMNRPVRPKKEI